MAAFANQTITRVHKRVDAAQEVLAVAWPEVPEAAEELLDWFCQACRATSDPFLEGDPR